MTCSNLLRLAALLQALTRVLAERFQQAEARSPLCRLCRHKHRLVDKHVESSHRLRRDRAALADCRDCIHIEAAPENRKSAEERLLSVYEQAVAPVQRGAQSPLALRSCS